jgi:uncharacterized protein
MRTAGFWKIETSLAAVRIVPPGGFKHGRPLQERVYRLDALPILGAIAGAFMLAGLVKGVIGLGLPTVAIGLLGLLMTPTQAAAILVLPALITNIWQAAVGGNPLPLVARLWPMLAGICIGTFIGAAFLPNGSQATVWLGVALLVYSGLGLVKIEFSVTPRAERWLNLPMGLLTGAITAATGVYVLPNTPYLHALQFDRHRLVQVLGISFTVSTLALGAALAQAGEMQAGLAAPALVALAAALIGMWLGQLVRGRIRAETFQLCFFIGLLLLGTHLALRGLL